MDIDIDAEIETETETETETEIETDIDMDDAIPPITDNAQQPRRYQSPPLPRH